MKKLELSDKEILELMHTVHGQIRNYESFIDNMKQYNQQNNDNYFVNEIAQYEKYLSLLNSIYERLLRL